MNTVLSLTRPDERERLETLSQLTHDTRVSALDRLSLRLGLWLLLHAERSAQRRSDREGQRLRALAREHRARTERENALVRAAITLQYR
ncbi:hypothetical protein [Microbacterium sp. KR10-403]|uniref:hypothetical protein n=1 Tax=Microbacterium sp. KR10-403 TaxID=3158581 RepID=UPI0032E3B0E2